ncbi:MAG: AraC family transcriptional regulator [Candidatus Aminicenantes bacterium]|jgi:AraC-like DNA-binding protein
MKKTNDDGFSKQVIKYILTRTNDELGELTIEKISCTLNISRSYLYERFKIENKFTPREFLVMIKMLRCAALLMSNEMLPVEEVAQKMGFTNLDYFRKLFKVHFGTTPVRYRKYIKKK